jgi:hypothetical protein
MSSPRLTVKSIAEILSTPNSNPAKIVRDQKYPKREPQVYQRPYYQIAVGGVRRYYRSNNRPSVLAAAYSRAQSIGNKAKRANNIRVIESFRESQHATRRFQLQTNRQATAKIAGVEIRLSADMQALENSVLRVVHFNCRGRAIDEAAALLVAEVSHWVLDENGINLNPSQIEVIDLTNGRSYRARTLRSSTIDLLTDRCKEIQLLWDRL